MKRALGAAALALSALFAACETEHVTKTITVKGTAVEHGEALFSDPAASPSKLNKLSCATCHLAEETPGDTRILAGAALAGATERPTFWGGQENDLLRSINACRFNFMDAQQPWAADDPDAEAMYAYLSSLAPGDASPAPFTVVKAVKDLEPGDAKAGASVYTRACATCHGAIHSGMGRITKSAPRLPDDTLVDHAEYSADEQRLVFVEKVRHGAFLGYSGNMPPFSKEALSDADLAALLAYLDLY